MGPGGVAIGRERRLDFAGDHGFDEPREGESFDELGVVGARRDLPRQGARGAGEIADEEQRLPEARVDQSVLATGRDGLAPVSRRLRVTSLFEAQKAEAEGGFGELGIARQRGLEGLLGAILVGKSVGDQGEAEPRARRRRIERERPFEDGAGFGRFARRMQRRAEVHPQRRVVRRDGRRGREHDAGRSRIARRPVGEAEPPQSVRRRRLLQE